MADRPSFVTALSIARLIAAPITLSIGGFLFYLGGTDIDILFGATEFPWNRLRDARLPVTPRGNWSMAAETIGRTLQNVFALIELFAVPIGTLTSAFALWYFRQEGVRILFSTKPAAQLRPEETEEVIRLPQPRFVFALALGALLSNGIVAGIAAVSLLRERVIANDAAAIADLEQTLSAEQAYAKINHWYFDTPECLMNPASCLPGYPRDGRVFLTETVFGLKHGYQREFYPGPPARAPDVSAKNLSSSSIHSFALVAYPSRPGLNGFRSFCFDNGGAICINVDGSVPTVDDGVCADRYAGPSCMLA